MQQTIRHTHVPHVPWSPKMTIRKQSAIPTPTQGYQKNPNEILYRMGRPKRDRNAFEAVEKAKEARNSHETKRTHTTKNDNTKPKHLLHANPRPPRRSKLNATSIVALERKKTSVRWSRNDKKKNRQNDQKLTSTSSRHCNHTDHPPKHIEYLQHSIEKGVNQPI